MKINNKNIIFNLNFQLFLSLYICYLISNINSSYLRVQSSSKSRLNLKSHLFPSTNQNCGILCLECSQNDLQSCITCKPGVFDYKNKCYNTCPENTYEDEEWQICVKCDSSCPICWGPNNDMCGNIKGVKTTAVLLENEIKQYFLKKKEENNEITQNKIRKNFDLNLNNINFNDNNLNQDNFKYDDNKSGEKEELKTNDYWLNIINVILKDIDSNNINPRSHKTKIEFHNNRKDFDSTTISIEDVYGSSKVITELPIGSFSRKNGIFIPIPSYLDENMEIIEAHWIYVKGAWLGNKWMNEWVPVLSSFIKKYGEKNKMYYENGGYWIYDNRKGILFSLF